jgi:hypothetical protein
MGKGLGGGGAAVKDRKEIALATWDGRRTNNDASTYYSTLCAKSHRSHDTLSPLPKIAHGKPQTQNLQKFTP